MWDMICWTICVISLLYHMGKEFQISRVSAVVLRNNSGVQHITIMTLKCNTIPSCQWWHLGDMWKKWALKHVVLWLTLLIWAEFAIRKIFSSGLRNAHIMFKTERYFVFCVTYQATAKLLHFYLIIHITMIITGQCCITALCHSFLLWGCQYPHSGLCRTNVTIYFFHEALCDKVMLHSITSVDMSDHHMIWMLTPRC